MTAIIRCNPHGKEGCSDCAPMIPCPGQSRVESVTAALDSLRSGKADSAADKADFEGEVWRLFGEAEELLLRKHHDYGPLNISLSPGGPLNGLRVRMHDKLARINNLIDKSVEPTNESLRDSFIDLLNYSAIALLVLDGDWPEP